MSEFNIGDLVVVAENATYNFPDEPPSLSEMAGKVGRIISGPDEDGDYEVESHLDSSDIDSVSPQFLTRMENYSLIPLSDLPLVHTSWDNTTLESGGLMIEFHGVDNLALLADLTHAQGLKHLAISRKLQEMADEKKVAQAGEAAAKIIEAAKDLPDNLSKKIAKILEGLDDT